jgi:hypothetical protein
MGVFGLWVLVFGDFKKGSPTQRLKTKIQRPAFNIFEYSVSLHLSAKF